MASLSPQWPPCPLMPPAHSQPHTWGTLRDGPGPHDLAGFHPLSVLPGFSSPSTFWGIALPPTSLLQEALLLPLTLEHDMLAPDTQQKPKPWMGALAFTAGANSAQWPVPRRAQLLANASWAGPEPHGPLGTCSLWEVGDPWWGPV